MEVAGRFVGKDQLWIHDYRAGYAHKLLLAAGKLVRKQIFLAHNVETVERVTNQAHALLARHVLVGKRYLKVFEYRQIVDQVIALEDKTHVCFVQFVALFYVQFVDGLSVKIKFAGPRAVQHADNAQQSGLSCPGRPHDGDKLRRLDVQVNPAKQEKFVRARFNGFFQIPQLNQCFHAVSFCFLFSDRCQQPQHLDI